MARTLAERLGLPHLDTGAMYRAVTLLAIESGTNPADGPACAGLAREMALQLGERVLLNGADATRAIRSERVDRAVSAVAAHPEVRQELVRRQREWGAAHGGGVVEGRDIGDVVFPQADLKIYLTAAATERVRRVRERAPATSERGREEAGRDLASRDSTDSNRAASPLKVPDDAIVVDSTHLSVAEVVEEVLSHL